MKVVIHSHSEFVHQLVNFNDDDSINDISDMVVGRRSSAEKLREILEQEFKDKEGESKNV